ncbi:TorF family putative porin [Azotobacter salinestris]|uniref:TorF family putative porin n=1 Tax=Azotobacter salinestris TaxID=69964 RepID=UPI001266D4FA|nr:TorF family putative porin [Azotobacter salinestris]
MIGRSKPLLALLAGAAVTAQAQMLERELGDFELKLGSTPSRSMAQGLVQPERVGTFYGGLDLTHPSGWYLGNWSPSAGVLGHNRMELDSYLGYKRPSDDTLGYELGLIRYSFPRLEERDRHELYAGISVEDSRLGTAWSLAPGRTDGTLLLDLDLLHPLNMDMSVQYANHALDRPVQLSDGASVQRFNDWSLNLSRPWLGLRVGVTYSGSDLRGSGCSAYSGQNAQCDDSLTLKLEHPLF